MWRMGGGRLSAATTPGDRGGGEVAHALFQVFEGIQSRLNREGGGEGGGAVCVRAFVRAGGHTVWPAHPPTHPPTYTTRPPT